MPLRGHFYYPLPQKSKTVCKISVHSSFGVNERTEEKQEVLSLSFVFYNAHPLFLR